MSVELKRQLATVLFADMVGYSRLMDENETQAIRLRNRMEEVVREAITVYGGEIIQFYGDGVLCLFFNTYEAVNYAAAVQRKLREAPEVPVRMGLHNGEVARDRDNIYGDPVNIASRIESFAVPGAVLFSDKVFDELRNHPEIPTQALGQFQLKNIKKPLTLHALAEKHLVVPRADELTGKGEAKRHSIAVLPFANMSADLENEYFSDGMSEELLNALAKVEALQVTARTSSFAYKGRNVDVRQIGRELGVESVLEGSVRKAGNRVRITAQLIDTGSGYHLLSETYDRTLDDIFAVQDEIAGHIASLLKKKLGIVHDQAERLVGRPTQDMQAYQLYLKGLFHWNKYNFDDTRLAIRCFLEAAQFDPGFSQVWAYLSFCYSFLGGTGEMPSEEAMPLAWEYSQKALSLDPQLQMAHCAQGLVHLFRDWDFIKAEAAFERARQAPEEHISYHYSYALLLRARGRFREAVDLLREAVEIDPISFIANSYLIEAYLENGQFEEAKAALEKTRKMYPDNNWLTLIEGWIHIRRRDMKKALQVLKTEIDLNDPLFAEFVVARGYAFAEAGQTERADNCLLRLEKMMEQSPANPILVGKAIVNAGLGRMDKVYAYLNRVVEKRYPGFIFILKNPQWGMLRHDPRFEEVLRKMNVRE